MSDPSNNNGPKQPLQPNKQPRPIPQSQHLTNRRLISMIREISSVQLIDQIKKNSDISISPYKHSNIDVLRWTMNFLDHTNEEDHIHIQRTVEVINEGVPTRMESTLTQQIMSSRNFINVLMKKGFFHYLLAKYKPFIFIKPNIFLEHFQKDIKWYKEYFANIIYKVYENWLEDYDYFDYLIQRGCVEIMTSQLEWKPIYQLFMKSIYDYKPRIKKQIVTGPSFFDIQKCFSCERQGVIPFENTIHKLREFMQTYSTKTAINMVKNGIYDTMDKEIQNYQKYLIQQKVISKFKGVDSDNRIPCLEYCIFKLDKFIIKSILYLQSMYEDNVRTNTFMTEDHILGVITAANKYLIYRDSEGKGGNVPSVDNTYPDDNRIKLFNFKSFVSAIENPHQWRHFKSKENSWIPIFSVQPVQAGQHLKILIKNSKFICLGICSEKSYKSNRRIFEDDQQAVFFHVFKEKIFNSAVKCPVQVNENIYSVSMKISQNKIDWTINDKFQIETITDKLQGVKQYAFASLCRGAEFQVIDF